MSSLFEIYIHLCLFYVITTRNSCKCCNLVSSHVDILYHLFCNRVIKTLSATERGVPDTLSIVPDTQTYSFTIQSILPDTRTYSLTIQCIHSNTRTYSLTVQSITKYTKTYYNITQSIL